jgi:hypothetical protein
MDWTILSTPYLPAAMTRAIAPSDCAADGSLGVSRYPEEFRLPPFLLFEV